MVLYLTGAGQRPGLEVAPPVWPAAGLRFDLYVITFSTMAAAEVLQNVEVGAATPAALAWVPLMRGGGDAYTLAKWKQLALALPNQWIRRALAGLARTFAGLVNLGQVWRSALKGWDVKFSDNFKELAAGRFGSEGLPREVQERIRAETDTGTLRRWFYAAVRAVNLEDFSKSL